MGAIAGPASVRVMRDPSGMLPCYFAGSGRCTLFASDAEILVGTGVEIDIDFEEIGRQLYRAFVPSPSTALRNIHELLAGFALPVPTAIDVQEPCWSPWDHVADRGDTPDRDAERLGRIVGHCVHAWASTRGRLLLSVSGGLDSSILAACLARAGKDIVCLTMFADDPAGDERTGDFQRLLAIVRLRHDQIVDVYPEFAGVGRIQGVLGVDEGRRPALRLRFGDHLQRQRCLARRFRPEHLDDAPPRQAADA